MKKLLYILIFLSFSVQAQALLCPTLLSVTGTDFDKPIKKDSRFMVIGNVFFNGLVHMGVIRISRAKNAEEALLKAKEVLHKGLLHEAQKIDIQGREACLYFGDNENINNDAVFVFQY